MKIALRADASPVIGTGHVMRQIALAQNLIDQGVQTFLFSSISNVAWLEEFVAQIIGLDWIEVEESDFSVGSLGNHTFDALMVDSYSLGPSSLSKLSQVIPRVGVFLDGPWQKIAGQLAIVPTLEMNPVWLESYRERFAELHVGPRYLMMRKELVSFRQSRASAEPIGERRIIVALGGSDFGHLTETLISALESSGLQARVEVFGTFRTTTRRTLDSAGLQIICQPFGAGFIEKLSGASLAIVGAGTTMAEVIFMGVPAIFVVATENQEENARVGRELGLGQVVFAKQAEWAFLVASSARAFLENNQGPRVSGNENHSLVDAGGARRVFEALVGTNSEPRKLTLR